MPYRHDQSSLTPLILCLLLSSSNLLAADWSGYLSAETRLFQHSPVAADQHGHNLSLAAQVEFYHEWDNRRQSLLIVPFVRWDQGDEERTHLDIREFSWIKAARDWELRLGIRKVFWGVTESQHLVDIINQTDLVENLDGEDKLGQPMINLAWIQDWGTLDLFLLPGFRERTFPGKEGRFRTPLPIDTHQTRYSSSQGEDHIDWAVRWSQVIGDWEIGLSHFSGTSRDPDLTPGIDAQGNPVLIPLYQTIDQTSLDLQVIIEDWLWKLEAISRGGQTGGRYFAAVGGFEYTLVGIAETDMDLGLLAEYSVDDRGKSAPTPFNNDLLIGARLAMNDVQSTEALFGIILDLDGRGRSASLEASRRLGESWKLNIESRFFFNPHPADPAHAFRDDDYLQVELAYYF